MASGTPACCARNTKNASLNRAKIKVAPVKTTRPYCGIRRARLSPPIRSLRRGTGWRARREHIWQPPVPCVCPGSRSTFRKTPWRCAPVLPKTFNQARGKDTGTKHGDYKKLQQAVNHLRGNTHQHVDKAQYPDAGEICLKVLLKGYGVSMIAPVLPRYAQSRCEINQFTSRCSASPLFFVFLFFLSSSEPAAQ